MSPALCPVLAKTNRIGITQHFTSASSLSFLTKSDWSIAPVVPQRRKKINAENECVYLARQTHIEPIQSQELCIKQLKAQSCTYEVSEVLFPSVLP